MKHWLLLFVLLSSLAAAESPTTLSLDEAVALALQHSKGAQLSVLKVQEAVAGVDAARRLRYPRIAASALSAYFFRPLEVKVSQGSLTTTLDQVSSGLGMGPLSPVLGSFPAQDMTLVQGSRMPVLGALTIKQPLSQLWKIGTGVRAAHAMHSEAEREAFRTVSQIRYTIEELYVGSILEQLRLVEHRARVAFEERKLRDAENARRLGELLDDAVLGQRASVVEARTELMRAEQKLARLSLQLADLIGRSGNERLQLDSALPARPDRPLEYWLERASRNPDHQIALATLDKARAGLRAARQNRIPELSLFASGFAQDGTPLLPSNSGAVGLTLSWDVFDFGRRDAEITQARLRQRSAELNVERLDQEAARQVRLMYQDFAHAEELAGLAEQARSYRQRAAELAHQSVENGLLLEAKADEADAALRKAEADLSAARCQRHLALLRLYYLVGEL